MLSLIILFLPPPKFPNKLRISICLLLFFSCFSFNLLAQRKLTDLALISGEQNHTHTETIVRKPLKPILKYNPVYWALNGSLTFYQKVISPQISAGCLYETSCSRFSRKALQEYGIIKGVALTADRLSRCNRISAAGISRDRYTAEGKVVDEPSMYRFE